MKILGRVVAGVVSALGTIWVVRALRGLPSALGASISAITPSAVGSSSYRNRRFHNSEPATVVSPGSATSLLYTAFTRRGVGRPSRPVPVVRPKPPAEAGELAVTWYGHATALVEVDGYRVLTDPVWSERVSPSRMVGPTRLHAVPLPLAQLPPVDAVVVSHDHYDHLDFTTVRELLVTQSAPFVVPIGVGAHLRHWGVPEERIVELDWGTSTAISAPGRADLVLTCADARHFSGRWLVRNNTLWASWVLAGPKHRVYFGGDTGYTKAFATAGAAHGPFDLTLLPIGAYNENWGDIHMNPEEAVRAHAELCGGDPRHGLLVPIHWATFNLAFHQWAEPVQRMLRAASAAGTEVAVPMPGERIDPDAFPSGSSWWEDVQ